jgi:hypothetical protein
LSKHLDQINRSTQVHPLSRSKNGKPSSKIDTEDNRRITLLEKELIDLLLEGNDEITGKIFDAVPPGDFTNERLSSLAKIIYDAYIKGNFDTAHIIEKVKDEKLKNYILSIAMGEYQISSSWDKRSSSGKVERDPVKYTHDTIKKYQIMKIDSQIKKNDKKIEILGNDPEILNLMKANEELRTEKRLLLNS